MTLIAPRHQQTSVTFQPPEPATLRTSNAPRSPTPYATSPGWRRAVPNQPLCVQASHLKSHNQHQAQFSLDALSSAVQRFLRAPPQSGLARMPGLGRCAAISFTIIITVAAVGSGRARIALHRPASTLIIIITAPSASFGRARIALRWPPSLPCNNNRNLLVILNRIAIPTRKRGLSAPPEPRAIDAYRSPTTHLNYNHSCSGQSYLKSQPKLQGLCLRAYFRGGSYAPHSSRHPRCAERPAAAGKNPCTTAGRHRRWGSSNCPALALA